MKQIQDSSTTTTRPTVTASGAVGWFRHANTLTKIKATKVTVDWLNDLQGSFIDLFTRTGITPTGGPTGDRNLYDAVAAMVAPKIDQTAGDARYVRDAGDTMTGLLTLSGDPSTNLQAATKQYADTKFAKTGGTLTGDVTIDKASGSASLFLSALAGFSKYIRFQTAGVNRWLVGTNTTGEGGSNTGADFAITAYDDAGSSLGNAVTIARSTKDVTLGGAVTLSNGAKTVTLSKNPTSAMHAATKGYVDGSVLKVPDGYVNLPNGLVMQWGYHEYTSGVGTPEIEVIMPMSFSTACLSVQITRKDGIYVSASLNVHTLNKNSNPQKFTFIDGDTTPNAIYWFAIGY